jgi:hypothetical protein
MFRVAMKQLGLLRTRQRSCVEFNFGKHAHGRKSSGPKGARQAAPGKQKTLNFF